ncbi:cytidine deaminase [Priestia endophytica]|uniref:cytidine deaminase n=1 Tax=Priestia endophytica TaxID=135735 RepID=UPI000F5377AD|nr:cytidine deaminase [Priestia endophytica]RPK10722.1 Cytidine deaminase [Priestia endophytica]
MKTYPFTIQDKKLVEEAKMIIKEHYEDDKHHIGAALRTKSGEVISAVHLEAYIGRISVCAEVIAIGSALSQGKKELHTIVAVRHPYSGEENRELSIVSPCGMCRELIYDYAPDCYVILEANQEIIKTKISELLPLKYVRG